MRIATFEAFNPFIKQLRTDKGWRVEVDVSEDQYDQIKNLPKVSDKVLTITIEDNERSNEPRASEPGTDTE